MKKSKIVILVAILMIVFSNIVFGTSSKSLKPNSDFYVYDEVGVISDEAKNYIIETNKKIYSASGSQVVVVVVDNLNDEDIFSYAIEVFRNWEIGGKGKDNGVLLLVSIGDSKVWISTGYGMEGAIPDSKAKRMIEDDIIPEFKNSDYEAGILAGFNDIIYEVANEYNLDLDELNIVDNRMDNTIDLFKIFAFIVFLIVLDLVLFKGRILNAINQALFISSVSNSNKNNRRGGPPFMGGGFGGGSSGGFGGSSGGGGRTGGGGAGGSW